MDVQDVVTIIPKTIEVRSFGEDIIEEVEPEPGRVLLFPTTKVKKIELTCTICKVGPEAIEFKESPNVKEQDKMDQAAGDAIINFVQHHLPTPHGPEGSN